MPLTPQINSINSHLYAKSSVVTTFQNLKSARSSRSRSINGSRGKECTSTYCTADPGTTEWKAYQSKRVRSLKNLKDRNKLLTNVASKLKPPTENQQKRTSSLSPGILKRSLSQSLDDITTPERTEPARTRSRSSSIRWKEPIIEDVGLKSRSPSPDFRASKGLIRKRMQTVPTNSTQNVNPGRSKYAGKAESTKNLRSSNNNSKASASSVPLSTSAFGRTSPRRLSKNTLTKKSTPKLTKGSPAKSSAESSQKSLHELILELKHLGSPPVIPDLMEKVSKTGKAPKMMYNRDIASKSLRSEFTSKLTGFKKTLSEYGKGIKKISVEIEESYRKHRRTTLDEIAVAIRSPPHNISDDFRKRPILRQKLISPITLFGGYLIRHVTTLPDSALQLNLTSFDRVSFQLEISIPPAPKKASSTRLPAASYFDSGTYYIDIDEKFQVLSIKLNFPDNTEEDVQLRVPLLKSVREDVQVVHPRPDKPNGDKILILAKL